MATSVMSCRLPPCCPLPSPVLPLSSVLRLLCQGFVCVEKLQIHHTTLIIMKRLCRKMTPKMTGNITVTICMTWERLCDVLIVQSSVIFNFVSGRHLPVHEFMIDTVCLCFNYTSPRYRASICFGKTSIWNSYVMIFSYSSLFSSFQKFVSYKIILYIEVI